MVHQLLEMTMIRSLAVAAGTLAFSAAAAFSQDSHTTRIEETSAYGATVTIEEGVRVFRPLPADRHVIVNPGGRTPLSLHYYDPATGVPVHGKQAR
jgi:hypothetical protein